MRGLLTCILTLALVSSLIGGGLFAHFSDTEQSTDNTFTAGKLDLEIDVNNGPYYNGTDFVLFDGNTGLKPEQTLERTVSLHLVADSLPGDVVMSFFDIFDAENDQPEPELAAGEPTKAPTAPGDLAKMLKVKIWLDADGDNVYDTGETVLFNNYANTITTGTSLDIGTLQPCVPVYVGISITFEQGVEGVPANWAMTDTWACKVRVTANQSGAEVAPRGNTLIAEWYNHDVIEIDSAGSIVWTYADPSRPPSYPLTPSDADRLASGNTLITDASLRVIEVNPSGAIVWSYATGSQPATAERLASGNTLIALPYENRVIEVDSAGTVVWQKTGLYFPYEARRLAGGNTLIADTGNYRVVEVDSAGTVVWQKTGLNYPLRADRLANGHTLITDGGLPPNCKIIEVNNSGALIWSYSAGLSNPADAERLADGNTLITDGGNNRVIEVDSAGNIVWQKTGLGGPRAAERL